MPKRITDIELVYAFLQLADPVAINAFIVTLGTAPQTSTTRVLRALHQDQVAYKALSKLSQSHPRVVDAIKMGGLKAVLPLKGFSTVRILRIINQY